MHTCLQNDLRNNSIVKVYTVQMKQMPLKKTSVIFIAFTGKTALMFYCGVSLTSKMEDTYKKLAEDACVMANCRPLIFTISVNMAKLLLNAVMM